MAATLKIKNTTTRVPFTARIVNKGDRYGADMCLTHKEAAPLIEFYDARYPFDKAPDGEVLGQFVSRYYVDTLRADSGKDRGLNLDGGIADWSLDVPAMHAVDGFIAAHV